MLFKFYNTVLILLFLSLERFTVVWLDKNKLCLSQHMLFIISVYVHTKSCHLCLKQEGCQSSWWNIANEPDSTAN